MAAQQRLRPDGFTVPFSRLAQHRWAADVGRYSRVAESSSAHMLTGAAACPEATRRRHATCGMSCPAPNPAAVPAQPPLPCAPNRRCRARPTAAPSRRKLPALEKAEAAGWLERSASFCSTASEGDPDSELGRPAAMAISGAQLSLLWGWESREWLSSWRQSAAARRRRALAAPAAQDTHLPAPCRPARGLHPLAAPPLNDT